MFSGEKRNTYLNTYLKIYVCQETRREKHQKNNPGGQNQPRGDSARRNNARTRLAGEAKSCGQENQRRGGD